ncbi:uncharacterized protein A4U43_UnF10010 [Asparagus officinalis]|uniref:Uncharacterized protein n=1 Tax=Asparagus officinalis TaxID=4686 RepID=A0A1R3L5J3_ASPOF|nr:uncharacterized protein A4U43_UnF10010 [Asparagus officinalis]
MTLDLMAKCKAAVMYLYHQIGRIQGERLCMVDYDSDDYDVSEAGGSSHISGSRRLLVRRDRRGQSTSKGSLTTHLAAINGGSKEIPVMRLRLLKPKHSLG